MTRDFWQLLGFLGVGLVFWIGGYMNQRDGTPRSVVFRPPAFVAWLCGNPRRDGRIDLGDGGTQLLGLIWLIVGPLLMLIGVEFSWRPLIVLFIFSVATILWSILMGWFGRRKRRQGGGKDK